MSYDYQKEVNEAIAAADTALRDLREADSYLQSAGNWGLFDMFGGGLFSTAIKHSKMNDAERKMNDAKVSLQRFSKELNDVDQQLNLSFNSGDFISFADYFFDGFVADWLVQSRINDAKAQVREAISRVEMVRSELLSRTV